MFRFMNIGDVFEETVFMRNFGLPIGILILMM